MHYIVNIDLVAGPDDKIVVNQVSMNLVVMTTTQNLRPTTPDNTPEVLVKRMVKQVLAALLCLPLRGAASSSFVKETLFAHIVMLSLYFILAK
ncbi:hypothetical protein Ocin01_17829 [Orchesella cincta]|uniref:Uncharacterized protein n=1 Tax=Orchesella cincta TaxID=48709 RepID=A0A1D2M7B2_ORCCI|nr:hypothetical protein Ocin01_17829 [Orchesella cincta]